VHNSKRTPYVEAQREKNMQDRAFERGPKASGSVHMHVRASPLRRLAEHLRSFPTLAEICIRAGLSVPGAMLAGYVRGLFPGRLGRPATS